MKIAIIRATGHVGSSVSSEMGALNDDVTTIISKLTQPDPLFIGTVKVFRRGVRINAHRVGDDERMHVENGESWISSEECAVATRNEVERPRRARQPFSAAH